jgi:hypothetical protein
MNAPRFHNIWLKTKTVGAQASTVLPTALAAGLI